MPICDGCKQEVDEVCNGNHCKACHVSVSWEDCTSGTFDARILNKMLQRIGLSKEEAKSKTLKSFKDAKL
ncbi:MAG: hypothetical protein KKB59_19115 [Spirochaetes bacterium]|nr:hypothetical protein [Spirochaetota bacterium]